MRCSEKRPTRALQREVTQYCKTIVLPYVKGLSIKQAIKRTMSSVNVRVVFQPVSTLWQHLVHVKHPTPLEKKNNVAYRIPCTVCPAVYIGQTGRLLEKRINEHKAAVKNAKCDVSAVADHVWNEQHQMNFQGVSVLAQEQNQKQRCFLESWFIQTHTTINRDMGSLLPVFGCLFRFYLSLYILYTL